MAGPIRISVLADTRVATRSVNGFADSAEQAAQRVVTGFADTKLEGAFGKAQEGFDVLDTRAMGFRDTITGVQDGMTAFQGLMGEGEMASATLGDKLLMLGMGVGDLASGMVNFIVPMIAATAGIHAQAVAAEMSTASFLAHKVATAASAAATGVMTGAQWLLNTAMAANPVGLVILAIVALIAIVVLAYKKSDTFRAIVNAMGAALKNAAIAVWNFITKAVQWVKDLPGRIGAAFTGANRILADAGRRIINGLWDGLRERWESVKSWFSDITSQIPSLKGPAARDAKLLTENGRLVIQGFQRGLESQYDAVQSSLGGFTDSLSASAGIDGTVSVQAAAAPAWAQRLEALLSGGLTISLESSGSRGDDALLELIRDRVRIKGGKGTVLGITA